MADIEAKKVQWLWRGRIPLGCISLLVGDPGAGKSLITCDTAARISTGAVWPDGGSAPIGSVLFLTAEDDAAYTIRPRLNAAGADANKVHLVEADTLIEEDGKEKCIALDLSNIELIRGAIAAHPDCKLVVIDPVGDYLGATVDAHRENEVRAALNPLGRLAADAGVAVLLVCHTRKPPAGVKQPAGRADDSVLGSRALVGKARVVLHLNIDDDDRDRRLILPGKINVGKAAPGLACRVVSTDPNDPDAPPRLNWEKDPLPGLHADDVITPANGERRGRPPVARDGAAEWLTKLLADGPLFFADVKGQAKASGLAMSAVRRGADSLGIERHKRGLSGRWYWALPGDQSEPRRCSESPPGQDRRCSKFSPAEHLRETQGKTDDLAHSDAEDAQNVLCLGVTSPAEDVQGHFAGAAGEQEAHPPKPKKSRTSRKPSQPSRAKSPPAVNPTASDLPPLS